MFSGLANRGHRVAVIASLAKEFSDFDDSSLGLPRGVDISRYSVPHFNYNAYRTPPDSAYEQMEDGEIREAVLRVAGDFEPDILVAGHETMARPFPELMRIFDVPAVVLVRGSPTWRIVERSYPPDLVEKWIKVFSSVTRVFTVAAYMAEGLDRLGVAAVEHIPNFLDTNAFKPRERPIALARRFGISHDDIVVMHASCMQPRKRALEIVESARTALVQNPNLIYLFVGEGDESERLRATCAAYDIEARVRFAGKVDYSSMPHFFNLADLVVQPSEGEGLSRVYLETQASGRVLIASDISPAREVVTHGETGLLARLGKVDDLTDKILRAAADPALRDEIGRESRRRVFDYAIPAILERYENAFEKILAEPS